MICKRMELKQITFTDKEGITCHQLGKFVWYNTHYKKYYCIGNHTENEGLNMPFSCNKYHDIKSHVANSHKLEIAIHNNDILIT